MPAGAVVDEPVVPDPTFPWVETTRESDPRRWPGEGIWAREGQRGSRGRDGLEVFQRHGGKSVVVVCRKIPREIERSGHKPRCGRAQARSNSAILGGAEFGHDICAMKLDGARAELE